MSAMPLLTWTLMSITLKVRWTDNYLLGSQKVICLLCTPVCTGAGRVSFTSTNSFISAVSSRFFQMTYGDVNKGVSWEHTAHAWSSCLSPIQPNPLSPHCAQVEVKPYVMDDQMCDECHGVQCNGKYAPFYCGSVSCLQYYCEHCWATVHSLPSKQLHRPLTKDTGDRPRAMPFRGHFN